MQKTKLVSSLFVVLFSLVAFAQKAAQKAAQKNDDLMATDQATKAAAPSVAASSPSLWEILIWTFILVAAIAVIVYICYWFWKRFDSFDRLNTSLDNLTFLLKQKQNTPVNHINNGMQYAHLSSTSEAKLLTAIDQHLSSSALATALNGFSEQTGEIQKKLDSCLEMAPTIANMNERMQQLISEQPELVNFSVSNAVELVKKCDSKGITTENIESVADIYKEFISLGFEEDTQIAECKKYYDARNQHDAERVKLEMKINQHEKTIEQLSADNKSLSQDKARLERESERLSGEKEKLSNANTKLTTDLNTAAAERTRLSSAVKLLCPDEVKADSLFKLLETASPALRAETVALVVQLYWFAQLSRNTPNKTKAAFTKFDETLYELFADKQELLQDIRKTILEFVNNEVFKETSYKVSWPLLDTSASEHEDRYNRENDEGNRISKVRSAVIFNAGKVESVARIYTSL